MKEFHLEIVTPEGKKFDGNATMISVVTTEGRIGILAGHTDLFAPLDIGEVKISLVDGERSAACTGGFLSVKGGKVSIAAVCLEFSDEIDVERAKKAKERAERAIAEKKDRAAVDAARIRLARALTRISVAERRK